MDKEKGLTPRVVLSEIANDLSSKASRLQSLGKSGTADILRVLASQTRHDGTHIARIGILRRILQEKH